MASNPPRYSDLTMTYQLLTKFLEATQLDQTLLTAEHHIENTMVNGSLKLQNEKGVLGTAASTPYFPKNLERRTGPSSSLSLPLRLDLDRLFFSFLVLFDLDRDLDFLEPLSSSSLLEDSEDELELDSDELLCC
jgi:hypothetical protein